MSHLDERWCRFAASRHTERLDDSINSFVPFLCTAGCGTSGCESIQKRHTHARTRQNESYARRTLAKLTRLECGTRAGWQCKFIQNSKEPSARSTSPTSRTRPSDFSLSPSVATLSRRLRPSGEDARGYRDARLTAKKRAITRPENSGFRRFVRPFRPPRSH